MTAPLPQLAGQARFKTYRDELVHDWMKIIAVLSVVLVPLFLLLDYVTMPAELLSRFAVYRGIATAGQLGLLAIGPEHDDTARF